MSFRYANPQTTSQSSTGTGTNNPALNALYASIPRPADPPQSQPQSQSQSQSHHHHPSSPASSLAYSQYAYSTTSGHGGGGGSGGIGSGRPRLGGMGQGHGRNGSSLGGTQHPGRSASNSSAQMIPQSHSQQAASGAGPSNTSQPLRQLSSREDLRPPLPQGMGSSTGSATGSSSGGRGQPGGRGNEQVARVHYQALRRFLSSWLENESPTSRASAREKLTRLTRSQFQELSTDVYDELVRRLDAEGEEGESGRSAGNAALPFLPVRQDFHPKRNQARQKLATLPKNRFKDLASDVFFELRRRFPEFDAEWERETMPEQRNGFERSAPAPPPSFPSNLPKSMPDQLEAAAPIYRDRDKDRDRDRDRDNDRNLSRSQRSSSERLQPGPARQPSRSGPAAGLSHSTSQAALTATSTNEMVVPNKSTIAEERMEVPYAQFGNDPDDESGDEEDVLRDRSRGLRVAGGSQEDLVSPMRESRHESYRPLEVKNRTSTVSAASSRRNASISSNHPFNSSTPLNLGMMHTASNGGSDAGELAKERKQKAELEAKLSGLERRLTGMEKDLDDTGRREKWERNRTRELEDEVRGLKEHSRHHAEELRSMQREIDGSKGQLDSERLRTDGRRKEDQVESAKWKERYQIAADEALSLRKDLESRSGGSSGDGEAEAVKELQNECMILMDELKSLSIRNEEMMAEKDADLSTIRELDAEVRLYKRRWEETRTDLRNLKATSMMFVAKPMTEDHLPASADGHVADIHVTAFQSAIDHLLGTARSSAPTGVLPAMKAVVEATTNISEDVKGYERQPSFPIDASALEVVKHQSTRTLDALMQAARNHAMSSGLSPVSLLDAAAGHVSANVIEIIKLLKIRKTIKSQGSKVSLTRLSIDDMRRRGSAGVIETLREPGSPMSPGGLGMPRQDSISSPLRSSSFSAASGEIGSMHMGRTASSGSFGPGSASGGPINRAASSQGGPNASYAFAGRSPKAGNALLPSPMNGYAGGLNYSQNGMTVRTDRTESVISTQSDSFDLDRKASVIGSRGPDGGASPALTSATSFPSNNGATSSYSMSSPNRSTGPRRDAELAAHTQLPPLPPRPSPPERSDLSSALTGDHGPITPAEAGGFRVEPEVRSGGADDDLPNESGNTSEWEELKPYLSTQSSALVNAISKLLAEIRNGGNKPNGSTNLLQDHLSEVIAIGSSIIAVSANSIPNLPGIQTGAGGNEGQSLLNELVACTDRLSEYQSKREFSRSVRQEIASAAFGMAKSLRALMKITG